MTRHRLLEVEYSEGKEIIVHFLPFSLADAQSPTLNHMRNANKEFLLAIRSLLDRAIERMEPEGEEGPTPKRQRVKVTEEKKGAT